MSNQEIQYNPLKVLNANLIQRGHPLCQPESHLNRPFPYKTAFKQTVTDALTPKRAQDPTNTVTRMTRDDSELAANLEEGAEADAERYEARDVSVQFSLGGDAENEFDVGDDKLEGARGSVIIH
ncbi:hypothetical protein PM082_016796 [Marasmius tenuissimus]|nr:hypothetical protein PM082_016796 [Marasmius tenuissimus]